MYVLVYVTCACIHMCVSIQIQHIHIHTHTHIYIYIYIHTHIKTNIHTHTHTHTHSVSTCCTRQAAGVGGTMPMLAQSYEANYACKCTYLCVELRVIPSGINFLRCTTMTKHDLTSQINLHVMHERCLSRVLFHVTQATRWIHHDKQR